MLLCASLAGATLPRPSHAASKKLLTERPRLVVILVVDQLRADYLSRHFSRFLAPRPTADSVGGFRYLMEEGSYFPIAEYQVMHTLTAPDHASLSTGAWPNRHGVVMNRYYDGSQTSRYCVGDRRFRVIGGSPSAQKRGTAPTNLLGPTLGDALKNAGFRGRVVSIALKDRAAILMGGFRADAAVWFDSKVFRWVTSTYYAPKGVLPAWIRPLNAQITQQVGKMLNWKSSGKGSGHSDDGPADGYDLRVRIGTQDSLETPYGHAITVDAAVAAIKHFQMGRDDEPDILWVGFSSFDYLGHDVGPNHRQMEESIVAIDREIARFLTGLHKELPEGLSRTAIVLTGDHGAPPMPAYLGRTHIRAGYLDGSALRQQINKHLDRTFSPSQMRQWVANHSKLHFYLNPRELKKAGVSKSDAERAAKQLLERSPNVAYVATSTEIRSGQMERGLLGRQIVNGYYPGRSGDIIVIPMPYFMPKTKGLTHITGYTYDRSVPLIFGGPYFHNRLFPRRPEIIDIVPTLAFLLGIVPPALSEGKVLGGVFREASDRAP